MPISIQDKAQLQQKIQSINDDLAGTEQTTFIKSVEVKTQDLSDYIDNLPSENPIG